MPKLTATDGIASATEIKRTAITPEDITKMSDEEIVAYLAGLRTDREQQAPRTRGGGASRRVPSDINFETVANDDDEGVDI